MKKVLIFYGSYGGGHLSAARNIKEYIDSQYKGEAETLLVDCIEYINKPLNKVSTKAYAKISKSGHWAWKKMYYSKESSALSKFSRAANRAMSIKLNILFQEYKPDIVISTHYFSSHMCTILKKKKKIDCKLATVMTDYAPHPQWIRNHEHVNWFFVAHEGMMDSLIAHNISPEKVYVTGIPLSNRFLANYDKEKVLTEFGLEMNKTTILFFAGGEYGFGKSKTYNFLRSILDDYPDMQVIAIAGKSAKAKEKFENIVEETRSSKNAKILSYTNKIPELMSVSDLVISKPGGLTTTESIASGLPMIAVNPIPGHEQENAEYLERNDIGIWIRKDDDVREKLQDILGSSEKIKKMKINARLVAKRNSTNDICKIVLES
ncbi:MAG: glycosyltransferase [Oscillospiraceae bacterium]|nr:glycosyltransferase [Oscillospiraceae bacterium]